MRKAFVLFVLSFLSVLCPSPSPLMFKFPFFGYTELTLRVHDNWECIDRENWFFFFPSSRLSHSLFLLFIRWCWCVRVLVCAISWIFHNLKSHGALSNENFSFVFIHAACPHRVAIIERLIRIACPPNSRETFASFARVHSSGITSSVILHGDWYTERDVVVLRKSASIKLKKTRQSLGREKERNSESGSCEEYNKKLYM